MSLTLDQGFCVWSWDRHCGVGGIGSVLGVDQLLSVSHIICRSRCRWNICQYLCCYLSVGWDSEDTVRSGQTRAHARTNTTSLLIIDEHC